MALRADTDLYVLLRGTGLYNLAAGAGDRRINVLWMDTLFHKFAHYVR